MLMPMDANPRTSDSVTIVFAMVALRAHAAFALQTIGCNLNPIGGEEDGKTRQFRAQTDVDGCWRARAGEPAQRLRQLQQTPGVLCQ